MNREALIEELAAIEHARWAHWQRYMHEQSEKLPDGSLVLPAHLVRRWQRQIETPYGQLSSDEKQSDRDQAERALPILRKFFPGSLDNV